MRTTFALLLAVGIGLPLTSGCRSPDVPNSVEGDGAKHVLWRDSSFLGSGMSATDASTVYALGFAHEVLAAAKANGDIRWRVTLRSGGTTYGVTIVLANGTVAAGDSAVYGLDPSDGHVRWIFGSSPGSAPGRFRLSTDGTAIYAGSNDGHVFAIDPQSGSALWTTQVLPASDVRIVDPKVDRGVVYVGYDDYTQTPMVGGVAAVDARSGAVLWSAPLPSQAGASTATLGAVVAGNVVVAGSRDGRIYGFDRTTGVVSWTAPPVAVPSAEGGSPTEDVRELASVGTTVYAASRTGYVTAIDATNGRVEWTAPTRYGSALWIAADASQVYVVHGYGQMTVLDAASGAVQWWLPTDGPAAAFAPALDGDQLYIGGARGLYALRAH